MTTQLASPNGIFKQLDLAEREVEVVMDGTAAEPSTPLVSIGHESMEITPGESTQQEVPEGTLDQDGGGVQDMAEDAANGNEDGGTDESKKKVPGHMSAAHAAYIAGVTRGADYEHAHDTVARAAIAATGRPPAPSGGRGAPSGGGQGRGRFGDQQAPRPEMQGPPMERPTHFTRGGPPAAGRGGPRPDMGRGHDSHGPGGMYNPAMATSVHPSVLAYYTRGADYEEAHDLVARAANSASASSAPARAPAGESRGAPAQDYQPAPAKTYQQHPSGSAPWQDTPKPAAAPQWGEAPAKSYQQGPPAYQAPPAQYQQPTTTYNQPSGAYANQGQPSTAPTGAPQATQGGYGETQAYQAPQQTYEQPSQPGQAQGYEAYSSNQYGQPQYGGQTYAQPTQPTYGQDYSQAPPSYAPAPVDYGASTQATGQGYQAPAPVAAAYPASNQYPGY